MEKIKKGFKAFLRFIVRAVVMFYCKLLYWYKVEGKENIPKKRPVIICANHQSFLDGQLLVAIVPRKVDFVVKKELVENSLAFKILAWIFDAIPVSRDNKDFSSIKTVLKDLKQGDALGIFPEGTRNGIAKKVPIKDGTAFFAIKSKAPVVCCGISGKLKPFTRTTVKFSKPLELESFTNAKSQEELKEVSQIIMKEICKLSGTNYNDVKALIQ